MSRNFASAGPFPFDLVPHSPNDISELPWKTCFRRFQLLICSALPSTSAISPASAQEKAAKLEVVATFSILGDFARNVGGNQVDVAALVGPDGDVHVYPPWTDEDMAKFEARWPRGTRERVIFDILAYTGLRIGDVAILGRQHLKQRTIMIDGEPVRRTVISIDSEKTGMRVELPLLPQLKATLDGGPTGDLAFIVTRRARPGPRARWGPNSWRRPELPGVVGNQPTACARPPRPGQPRTGQPNVNWRRSSAGPGGGWRPLHQKREPRQACRGGHRQARPCRDRK